MLSTNYAIHRNEVLNTDLAITNVLKRTDKLIKDYRFFYYPNHFDNIKIKVRKTYIVVKTYVEGSAS